MTVRVFAMGRPARPPREAELVRQAARGKGTVAERAKRLGFAVARAAIEDMDLDPAERIVALLRAATGGPVDRLASDPDIDTSGLILAERIERLTARGGRRLSDAEWEAENTAIVEIVAQKLARRYRRLLP